MQVLLIKIFIFEVQINSVKGPKRPIFEIFDLLKNKIFLYR